MKVFQLIRFSLFRIYKNTVEYRQIFRYKSYIRYKSYGYKSNSLFFSEKSINLVYINSGKFFPIHNLTRLNSMKKALLVAASLFTTATAVTTGEAVKASPQFSLVQNTAGNLIFQGVGTAEYNNSIGTNNSFQVGSTTNLGVNASTSSTPEYGVTSHAKLDLAGNSTLKQIIGTSGSNSNVSAEQVAAMTYAHNTASSNAHATATEHANTSASSAQSSWESTNSNSWEDYRADYYVAETDDYDFTTGGGAAYTSESEWSNGHTSSYDNAHASAYETKYETEYENEYSSAYTTANSNVNSLTTQTGLNGIIQGTFTTREFGQASSGANMSAWHDSATESANEEVANQSYYADWSEYQDNNQVTDPNDSSSTVFSSDATYQTETAYEDARSNAYATAYDAAFGEAANGSHRTSESDVTVTGIGSDALVTAKSTSTFDTRIVNLVNDSGITAESTATATGAAGANLSTSSFANQSMASTASAFMQAFGAADAGSN